MDSDQGLLSLLYLAVAPQLLVLSHGSETFPALLGSH